MRAICFLLLMLVGLSLPSFAAPLEDQSSSHCQRRDAQSLRDCYIKLLKTFIGHPRQLRRMDPRDATAFCDLVAGEIDARFCARIRGVVSRPWTTRLEATTASLSTPDPWRPVLEPVSETMADAR